MHLTIYPKRRRKENPSKVILADFKYGILISCVSRYYTENIPVTMEVSESSLSVSPFSRDWVYNC